MKIPLYHRPGNEPPKLSTSCLSRLSNPQDTAGNLGAQKGTEEQTSSALVHVSRSKSWKTEFYHEGRFALHGDSLIITMVTIGRNIAARHGASLYLIRLTLWYPEQKTVEILLTFPCTLFSEV